MRLNREEELSLRRDGLETAPKIPTPFPCSSGFNASKIKFHVFQAYS